MQHFFLVNLWVIKLMRNEVKKDPVFSLFLTSQESAFYPLILLKERRARRPLISMVIRVYGFEKTFHSLLITY